jgi:hypothetical protein
MAKNSTREPTIEAIISSAPTINEAEVINIMPIATVDKDTDDIIAYIRELENLKLHFCEEKLKYTREYYKIFSFFRKVILEQNKRIAELGGISADGVIADVYKANLRAAELFSS